MKEISISELAKNCCAILEEVKKNKEPILVMKSGKTVAEIIPSPVAGQRRDWIDSLRGKLEITGDIVAPMFDESEWKA